MWVKDTEFWSMDRKFGLKIPRARMKDIHSYCTKSKGSETGGIMIGSYRILTRAIAQLLLFLTSALKDSRSGSNWFYREKMTGYSICLIIFGKI